MTPLDGLIPDTDYDEQNDIRFYKMVDVPAVQLHMLPGSFALFFPQDSHCPQLTPPSGMQDVMKVVLKVPFQEFQVGIDTRHSNTCR